MMLNLHHTHTNFYFNKFTHIRVNCKLYFDLETNISEMFISYEQAYKMVHEHLSMLLNKRRLKIFCTENELNYRSVYNFIINIDTKREYPKLVIKLLACIGYDAEVKKETFFKINLKKGGSEVI